MKMMAKFMLMMGLLSAILAGCGTAQNVNDDASSGSEPAQNEEEITDTEGQSGQNAAEEEAEDATEEDSDSVIRINEQNMSYTVNGETNEDTAFLKYSDNQNYSVYVLPGYELTAEEPNKDILYFSENDQVFMRIELLPDDAEWSMIEENMKAQLAVVNDDVQTSEAPEDEFYKEATFMTAKQDNEKVSAYLIKNDKLFLKLTLFTKEDQDHEDAFLQMAKTIMKEQPQ